MNREFRLRLLTGVGIVVAILSCVAGGALSWSLFLFVLAILGWREACSAFALAWPTMGRIPNGMTALAIVAFPIFGLWSLGWRSGVYSAEVLVGWFVLVWANDSAAYLVGRRWGRTPIAPALSPGKTWEGWAGGLVATVLLGGFVVSNSVHVASRGVWLWVGLALVVSVFGPLGDFMESGLKRKAGIKDSGELLPGHGGVLDRFDSHFFAAPVAAIVLHFV